MDGTRSLAASEERQSYLLNANTARIQNWIHRCDGDVYQAAQQMFEYLEGQQWLLPKYAFTDVILPQVLDFSKRVANIPPEGASIVNRLGLMIIMKSLYMISTDLHETAVFYNKCSEGNFPLFAPVKEGVALHLINQLEKKPEFFKYGEYNAVSGVYTIDHDLKYVQGCLFASIASWMLNECESNWLFSTIISETSHVVVHRLQCFNLIKQKKYPEALVQLELYLSHAPRDKNALQLKSKLLVQLGQFETAQIFTKNWVVSFHSAENFAFLANIYWRTNSLDQAKFFFNSASCLTNEKFDCQLAIALIEKQLSNHVSSFKTCKKALKLDKTNSHVLNLLGELHYLTCKLQHFAHIIEEFANLPNGQADRMLWKGYLVFMQRKYQLAKDFFETGLSHEPLHSRLHLGLAKCLHKMGQTMLALQHLEKAIIFIDKSRCEIFENISFFSSNLAKAEAEGIIDGGNTLIKDIIGTPMIDMTTVPEYLIQLDELRQFGYTVVLDEPFKNFTI